MQNSSAPKATEIIFATGNKAKLSQAEFVAEQMGIALKVLNGKKLYGDDVEYDEIGESTEAIARDGALNVAKRLGKPVIAEDTDFCADALNGFPGIRGGLFLKTFGRAALHKMMAGQENRVCTITSSCCYATPEGEVHCETRTIKGTMAEVEKFDPSFPDWVGPGSHPFGGGYSSIFIPDGETRTLGEISPEEALKWGYREQTLSAIFKHLTK